MKKILFFIAAAVVALAGCKPDTTPSEGGGDKPQDVNKYTSIRFKESELILGVEESSKLHLLWEPVEIADAPVCEWASSDPEVATVDQNGTVIGVATGEANVTATFGELKAVCKVTVQGSMDAIKWVGWGLWSLDKETILSNDTVLRTLQSGQQVSCLMIPATYKVWSDGIYLDEEGLLNGAGYLIDLDGTALLITDDLGKGKNYHYLGTGRLEIVENMDIHDTLYASCAFAGALGTAEEHMAWLQDSTNTVEPAFIGRIYAADFDEGEYIDPFSGIVGEGIFVGDETTALYKVNVSWFEEPQYWGLAALEDYSDFVDPLQWAPLTPKYYEYLGEEKKASRKYTVKEFVAPKNNMIIKQTDKLTKK